MEDKFKIHQLQSIPRNNKTGSIRLWSPASVYMRRYDPKTVHFTIKVEIAEACSIENVKNMQTGHFGNVLSIFYRFYTWILTKTHQVQVVAW